MINYEVALGQLELFVLILIRLASFVYAAPFFNTANVLIVLDRLLTSFKHDSIFTSSRYGCAV